MLHPIQENCVPYKGYTVKVAYCLMDLALSLLASTNIMCCPGQRLRHHVDCAEILTDCSQVSQIQIGALHIHAVHMHASMPYAPPHIFHFLFSIARLQ